MVRHELLEVVDGRAGLADDEVAAAAVAVVQTLAGATHQSHTRCARLVPLPLVLRALSQHSHALTYCQAAVAVGSGLQPCDRCCRRAGSAARAALASPHTSRTHSGSTAASPAEAAPPVTNTLLVHHPFYTPKALVVAPWSGEYCRTTFPFPFLASSDFILSIASFCGIMFSKAYLVCKEVLFVDWKVFPSVSRPKAFSVGGGCEIVH